MTVDGAFVAPGLPAKVRSMGWACSSGAKRCGVCAPAAARRTCTSLSMRLDENGGRPEALPSEERAEGKASPQGEFLKMITDVAGPGLPSAIIGGLGSVMLLLATTTTFGKENLNLMAASIGANSLLFSGDVAILLGFVWLRDGLGGLRASQVEMEGRLTACQDEMEGRLTEKIDGLNAGVPGVCATLVYSCGGSSVGHESVVLIPQTSRYGDLLRLVESNVPQIMRADFKQGLVKVSRVVRLSTGDELSCPSERSDEFTYSDGRLTQEDIDRGFVVYLSPS